jgi:hypothetical protein
MKGHTMSNRLESTISINLEIPASLTKNPDNWLCEIVHPIVSQHDESIDMDKLRKHAEYSRAKKGRRDVRLFYDNFDPTFDYDTDSQALFDSMTARIKDAFHGHGVTGTISIYAWYTDPPPDVSAFVHLESPTLSVVA